MARAWYGEKAPGFFSFSFVFFDWAREFRDFTDAFGVGRMRARNKCSADFRAVPARFNAKEGRFRGSDVSVTSSCIVDPLFSLNYCARQLMRRVAASERSKIHGFDQLRTNHLPLYDL
jgi:hypothetical protein